jgi:hypothetical protein
MFAAIDLFFLQQGEKVALAGGNHRLYYLYAIEFPVFCYALYHKATTVTRCLLLIIGWESLVSAVKSRYLRPTSG